MIGFEGVLPSKTDRNDLVHTICEALTTECMVFPFGKELIQRVAIVSGGAAKELSEAIEKDVDCYITGEPIHENYHSAIEAGINVIYAGHYHTEKSGVQALGKLLEKEFNLETVFLDIPPVIERHVSGISVDSE
jgi:putative NIF3 family GTP cyclohydrolase 1 type 2